MGGEVVGEGQADAAGAAEERQIGRIGQGPRSAGERDVAGNSARAISVVTGAGGYVSRARRDRYGGVGADNRSAVGAAQGQTVGFRYRHVNRRVVRVANAL